SLYSADDEMSHVYFPGRSTMISFLAQTAEGESAEIGVTGREGVAPIGPVLGAPTSPHQVLVQIPGAAVRIPSTLLQQEMDRDQSFRKVLLRFAHAFFCQTSQTALCNALHEVEQRLARWLLVSHDRDEHDELPLTHEFLARMLGTNRATI